MKPELPVSVSAPAERGRARGRGRGRSRRDEERDRNVETFGEAGGIGLLGPGQYVSGFDGFRGRKRRGSPRVRDLERLVVGEDVVLPGLLWFVHTSEGVR